MSVTLVRRMLGVAIVALLFSGCGSSSTTAGNGTTPSTATPATITHLSDYCNLATKNEVAQITGLAITQVLPVPNDTKHIVACGYAVNISNPAGAIIFYYAPANSALAQTYYMGLKHQAQSSGATITDLSGTGDEAFASSQNGVDAVVTRKGTVVFTTGGSTHHSLPLAVDKKLALLVASKV